MPEQSFPLGFRVIGGRDQERRLIDWNTAFLAHLHNDDRADNRQECYLSGFQFSDDFRDYLKTHGSTKGFKGPTWSSWLWFDIDREDDIDTAMIDARRLVVFLCARWHIDAGGLLIFFSGSKGFHIGLPSALWNAEPAATFHAYAKHFATSLAALAEVEIDTGVYDRVRLFRAPNSRHQKTGRHKRRLTADEFFGLTSAEMLTLAQTPDASELPPPLPTMQQAVDDWADAVLNSNNNNNVSSSNAQRQHVEVDGLPGYDDIGLNALTRVFIAEGALIGDRHRQVYSAARNLAEFQCPRPLAYALLMQPARDSGLCPSDARRQIDCGLNDGGQQDG